MENKFKQPTIQDFIQGKVTYDKEGQYFWAEQKNGGVQMLGELRGWGHIQNMFKFGVKYLMDEAAIFQDELGAFVAEAINEHVKRAGVVENFAQELTKEPQSEALNKHDVMGRSELLLAFCTYLEKEGGSGFIDKQLLVDEFLKASNSP